MFISPHPFILCCFENRGGGNDNRNKHSFLLCRFSRRLVMLRLTHAGVVDGSCRAIITTKYVCEGGV